MVKWSSVKPQKRAREMPSSPSIRYFFPLFSSLPNAQVYKYRDWHTHSLTHSDRLQIGEQWRTLRRHGRRSTPSRLVLPARPAKVSSTKRFSGSAKWSTPNNSTVSCLYSSPPFHRSFIIPLSFLFLFCILRRFLSFDKKKV